MHNYQKYRQASVSVAAAVALALFVLNVNPQDKPLPVLLIPVILGWIVVYGFLNILLNLLFNKNHRLNKVISFALTTGAVFLLLISGVGAITVGDLLLVVALVVIGTFYFYKTWF